MDYFSKALLISPTFQQNIRATAVTLEERKQRGIYFSCIFQYLIEDALTNLIEVKSFVKSIESHVNIRCWDGDLQELFDAYQPLLLIGKRKLKQA